MSYLYVGVPTGAGKTLPQLGTILLMPGKKNLVRTKAQQFIGSPKLNLLLKTWCEILGMLGQNLRNIYLLKIWEETL